MSFEIKNRLTQFAVCYPSRASPRSALAANVQLLLGISVLEEREAAEGRRRRVILLRRQLSRQR